MYSIGTFIFRDVQNMDTNEFGKNCTELNRLFEYISESIVPKLHFYNLRNCKLKNCTGDMRSGFLWIASIATGYATSVSEGHEESSSALTNPALHVSRDATVRELEESDEDTSVSFGFRKSIGEETDASTPLARSAGPEDFAVTLAGDVCNEVNTEWVIDYFILREGYDHSHELRRKLDWFCSRKTDETAGRFTSSRTRMMVLLSDMEESVDDLVYSIEDVETFLNETQVEKTRGGKVFRHDALETLSLAMDTLWLTRHTLPEDEINFREAVALYLAEHAVELGYRYEWVSEYCFDDRLPLSLFPATRTAGTDYGSNIDLFSILKALKTVNPEITKTVDGIVAYVYTRRIKIKGCWEMTDVLDQLIQSVYEFVYQSKISSEVFADLEKSLQYLIEFEESIFM